MQLLLDTHTFLWWTADDPQLSSAARAAIANAANDVFISAVSGWEMAIKARLGRLPLPEPPDSFMARMIGRHALSVLPVTMRHALHVFHLPEHHSDPFDRLLVAQANLESMTLITNDAAIRRYSVSTLW